jgi:uncharacterized protein (TIGR00251 family)
LYRRVGRADALARHSMIEVTPGGVIIAVRVIPRAGKTGPAGARGDALLMRLNAPPVDGAANAELIEALADLLSVPKSAVTIVSGARARTKRVRVAGIDLQHAASRLPH